jgi:hypothetical protein
MLLGSFVVALVSHAFLAQNRLYATQALQAEVQENVRAGTELLARAVRETPRGGVIVAGSHTLTVRSPVAVAGVCFRQGSPNVDVFSEGGAAALDEDAIAGVALWRDNEWSYRLVPWNALRGNDVSSAANCAETGADTVGVRTSFYRLSSVNSLFPGGVRVGDVVMLFRETTLTIRPSELDPSALGLFQAEYAQAATEFATGVDTTARFRFRIGPGQYVDTVTAADLARVDAVRFEARARRSPPTGSAAPVTFGWTVDLALRNVR